jgi:PAS domain S-box-containing protein
MRALIVEDDAATRALLAITAQDRQHDVHAFADAEAVWGMLASTPDPIGFDLAVVDIGLPGQDGIDFTRQFRRHSAGRHAIVLLVTGDDRPATLRAALDAGAHDYIIKPVDRQLLAVRLAVAEQRSLAGATSRYSREALRESEHRFEAFMTNTPALAFIKDAHGHFLYVNRRYLETFGVTEADVIGRRADEIFDEATAGEMFRNDRVALEHGPREFIETVPVGGDTHSYLSYKFPLGDSSGRPALVAGLAIDITDRLRAEDALRAQTARAEALLQVATLVNARRDLSDVLQGICDLTRATLDVDVAAVLVRDPVDEVMSLAAIAGGSEDVRRVLGRVEYRRDQPRDEIDVVSDLRTVRMPTLNALADRGLSSVVYIRMVQNDDYIGVLGVGSTVQREFTQDEVKLLRGIAHQAEIAIRNQRLVDERQRSEEQLRNAQKLESLGVLAGGIAHDFNNLLVGVLGNAGMAMLELPEDSPARQPIRDIEVSAQRAAELTRQMLAYSGRGRVHVEPVDLSHVVEEMSQLLRRVISRQAQLSLRLRRGLPAVVADVTQIRQVVMNLITNASDALGESHGTITLETSLIEATPAMLASTYLNEALPAGPYVCLEVSDTGSGMSPETAARIFEPFFTTKFTGRGLGLAAVLGIVRGHKGAIDVQSTSSAGTTFRVLLPASTRRAETTAPPVPAPLGHGSGLVLLVDDEDSVRGLARRVLERGGYSVLEATSGEEALERLAREASDVRAVVLDLTMPGLSGEATLQEIRRRRIDVPVIVSSGYVPEEEGTLAGVPFLAKPYKPSELIKAVRTAMESA